MRKIILTISLSIITIVLLGACTSKSQGQQTQTDADSLTLKIMTFNMRYDNKNDGNNQWQFRVDSITKMIENQAPDIIGAQEVLKNMLDDLTNRLPQYESIGVGREDGVDKGEFAPILYLKEKFGRERSGYFWLRPDSLHPGKGWDAACERIVTWAIFKEHTTHQSFLLLNTHFDHVGQEARQNSVKMILNTIARLSPKGTLPVILTGDFNATPTDPVITTLTDQTSTIPLTDTRSIAHEVEGPTWSFHDFGKIPIDERPLLDYIFIKGDIDVKTYTVLEEAESPMHIYLSDHSPIITSITLQP